MPCLRALSLAYSLRHPRSAQRDEPLRIEFRRAMIIPDVRRIINIDECHVNTKDTRRMFGWALRGLPAFVRQVFNEQIDFTIIGACTVDGLLPDVCGTYSKKRLSRADHKAWFVYYLLPIVREGDVIVADNASVHDTDFMSTAVEHRGAQMLWLPPYSRA